MAKGHVQGSFHGAQLGFRCHESFCVCFHYSDWIVVAEFSPYLPSPSWDGKYEVSIFVSTVLSVWPCLGVANLNIIMDNFCIWFDWLAAPPSLIQQSQHTDITDYWDKKFYEHYNIQYNFFPIPYLLIMLPDTFKEDRFERSSTPSKNN